ncbi:MAG TPA: ABC transporter transmembrane domain-containing protein, partial [Novosphingobium sp.]|nr:ABC transporter transmembrane domain-containing protein [Novosphingobium sp.]
LGATIAVARTLHGSTVVWSTAALAAMLAFGCEALLRRLSEGLGLDYVTAVRDALFRHLMQVDPAIVQSRRHGAMLQSFVGDLTALRQWVAEGIMRAWLALIALTGLLGWLAWTTPTLGLTAFAITALACLAGLALLRPLARAVRTVRKERGTVAAFASERLVASATVLACARTSTEARRLERRVARLNTAALRRAWLTGLLRALPHLAATAIVIAAARIAPQLPASGMAGLVLVIGIIGLALRDLARAAELAVPGRVSRHRIARMLALPVLTYPDPAPWQRGETRTLVLEAVRLTADQPPLSARLERGEVALLDGDPAQVGALLRILAGLAQPQAGAARWNGADLLACRPARRRRIVGLASADLPLLRGSLGMNLRYRQPDLAAGELAALAAAWSLDPTSNEGSPQVTVLLRALAGKPPVLLLAPDERLLSDSDAARLADVISHWPGVVLLAARHPALSRRATRHWQFGPAGLIDLPRPTPSLVSQENAA